ncbi:MAG: delta-class carbonic anhydrase [Cellvibrionaceae bacterium]|nr:delta-class carbonic anhydrase [Cellvibrionaceae bacterium]
MTSTKKAAPASPTKADTPVADKVIAAQRQKLASSAGLAGPQSPRNIDERGGDNEVYFSPAPPRRKMNLCNIHFVKNASHAGGEFTVYAGNGDGAGNNSGYRYSGELSEAEKKPYKKGVCKGEQGALQSGDTIEVHYVHTTAAVTPGPGLESCMVESIHNPQLRIEAQVMVLVNDKNALDFNDLAAIDVSSGRYQALGLPTSSGTPVSYAGSTTGPQYNETPSPLLVTWAVRPKVVKVNIGSMPRWCRDNIFKESHAHGVRNLVLNPKLLSPIRVAPLP